MFIDLQFHNTTNYEFQLISLLLMCALITSRALDEVNAVKNTADLTNFESQLSAP